MHTLPFQNGDHMPALGLGTWKSAPGKVYEAVKTAIQVGYRHIDCAPIYGNEPEVGKALREVMDQGLVKREDLWITSKLWNNAHAREDVLPALRKTLKDLQLDYLDLYLVHWPIAMKKDAKGAQSADDLLSLEKVPLTETWSGMEAAAQEGLARHIGISNFGKKNIQLILDHCEVKPEMNQVECHPYLQQDDLIAFCRERGIHITAYSPLGSGDRPDAMKAKDEPSLLENPTVLELAKAKDITPGQVLISWALHRGTSVIPKSTNAGRIAENFKSDQIKWTDAEMAKMAELNKDFRYVNGKFWVFEDGPYTLTDVWK